MAKIKRRKLPVGVQSFRKIREEGYLYVDKTDIVWELANNGDQYNYLSRPRRFGKSVLVDTLESYFLGRKDLFEGLKIMEMEEEWNQYPVIRLDMSRGGLKLPKESSRISISALNRMSRNTISLRILQPNLQTVLMPLSPLPISRQA